MSEFVKVERNIYRAADGRWRVFVRVRGRLVPRRLPAKWTLPKVRETRDDLRYELRNDPTEDDDEPARADTFAADAKRYLEAVRTMPSIKDRRRDIGLWVAAFGERRRKTIKTIDIDIVLQEWLAAGKVSEPTIKKRRTALQHLYTRLDGRGARNPVRDALKLHDHEAEARAIPYGMVRVLLHLMRPSKTRARLAVIAFVGLAHTQIGRLEREDLAGLDAAKPWVWVRRRAKGKGAKGFPKPLTDDGVAALRALAAFNAWGPFSRSSVYKSFKLACGKIALAGVRPYDLKHTYVTELYDATGDIQATQEVAGHRSMTTTRGYALRAVQTRAQQAAAALGARQKLPGQLPGNGNQQNA